MNRQIHMDAPNVGRSEKTFLARAVDSGYVSSIGPFVAEFEKKFSRFLNVKGAVSTQSGTSAIHMALYELGIGKGDEVIVPALTFVASVNPIIYLGAKPVFADVDPVTWNIAPEEIERLITKNTKAILPVHLYGNPCDMDRIMKIAGKYNLRVIEDATESLGAIYRKWQTGTFGDFGCFSFNGNKVITTGGGGMIIGRDIKKIEHIKFLVNQAKDVENSLYHSEIGFNYRMTNIEAALGLAQFEKIEKFLDKKRNIYSIYREALAGISSIRFQEEYDNGISSHWFTCISFARDVDMAKLQRKLKNHGVPTRRVFMPITEFPPYKRSKRGALGNSYSVYGSGLCLPSSILNSGEDIRYAAKKIRELVDL